MKTKDLGWKEDCGIQNTGTEDSQENMMAEPSWLDNAC